MTKSELTAIISQSFKQISERHRDEALIKKFLDGKRDESGQIDFAGIISGLLEQNRSFTADLLADVLAKVLPVE